MIAWCKNPDCGRDYRRGHQHVYGYGYCAACYRRWQRHGYPETGPPKPDPRSCRPAAARAEDYGWLRSEGLDRESAAARVGVSYRTAQRYEQQLRGVPWTRELQPCGTEAAYRRHLDNDEKPCDACRATEKQRSSERRAQSRGLRVPVSPPKEREIRDPAVPYRYRARRYPWAVRVLEYAESVHGRPEDEEAA